MWRKTINLLDDSTLRTQMKIVEAKLIEESSGMRRIRSVDKIAIEDIEFDD